MKERGRRPSEVSALGWSSKTSRRPSEARGRLRTSHSRFNPQDLYDLSAASVLVFSSMVIAVLNVNLGLPVGVAVLIALGMGLVVGLINSYFVVKIGINSLIVTLGVGTVLNGLTLWISNSQTISGISDQLVNCIVVYRLFGIPLEFYYGLLACVLLWYVFDYTADRPPDSFCRSLSASSKAERDQG